MGCGGRNLSRPVPKRSDCIMQCSKLALQLPARVFHTFHYQGHRLCLRICFVGLQLGRGGHRLPILTRDKRQVVGRNRHYVPARGLTSKSSKWEPAQGEDLVTVDKADAQQGRIANRAAEAQQTGAEHSERMSAGQDAAESPDSSEVLDQRLLMGCGVRGDPFVGRGTGRLGQGQLGPHAGIGMALLMHAIEMGEQLNCHLASSTKLRVLCPRWAAPRRAFKSLNVKVT